MQCCDLVMGWLDCRLLLCMLAVDTCDGASSPAVSIMEGGIEGIFTPMHMLVFQKPENAKSPAKSPSKKKDSSKQ